MRIMAALFATSVVLISACGSSSEVTAESGQRGGSAGSSESLEGDETGTAGDGDFCSGFAEMSAEEVSIDENPEAARASAEQMRALAESAPPEVADAIGVFADLVDSMADVDPDSEEAGMDALGEMMELMFSPEVISAGIVLEEYLVDECGMDPAEAGELFGADGLGSENPGEPDVSIPEGDDQFPDTGGGASGSFDDDPDDISLDDMKAVEEANAGSSWTQKSSSTGIANDQFISISTSGDGDRAFTQAEALEACDVIRVAFEGRQPALEVEILNGETVVAMGKAGSPCTTG